MSFMNGKLHMLEPGDVVTCVDAAATNLVKDGIYTVCAVDSIGFVMLVDGPESLRWYSGNRFEYYALATEARKHGALGNSNGVGS